VLLGDRTPLKRPTALWVVASLVLEKLPLIVIPNEVRNLSVVKTQDRRDSSARSVPRNDNVFFRSLLGTHRERFALMQQCPNICASNRPFGGKKKKIRSPSQKLEGPRHP
jgi:hypothetical protein